MVEQRGYLPTRRRFLTIAGAAAGGAAFPAFGAGPAPIAPFRWRGLALGAEAEITLYHPDPVMARALVEDAVAEVGRLEEVFSLWRPSAAIARLNRDGRLDDPPSELVHVLDYARLLHSETGGAFDPTVQPLWQLYARHFAAPDAEPRGPDPAAVARVLGLVDGSAVEIGADAIRFARAGMGVTLNGIAQGYITDCVADRLRSGGIEHLLVNLGEFRAASGHPGGDPWHVGLADPDDPRRIFGVVDMRGGAVATSGGYGTVFDREGRHHHLFDPKSGASASFYDSVSVVASRAMTADGLSTALAVMPPRKLESFLSARPGIGVVIREAGGGVRSLGEIAFRSVAA